MKNIIFLLVGLLFFILPIPHTIAIRNILIGLLSIISLYLLWEKKINILKFKEIRNVSIILLILTVWIIIDSVFFSFNFHYSLKEFYGQWLIPLLYFYVFLIIGGYYVNNEYNKIKFYTVIFLMFFIHILFIDLYGLKQYILHKVIITKIEGLTEGPDKSNYLTNVLLSFIMAEFIYRFRTKKNFLPFNNILLSIFLILAIISSVFESMRNGVIAILFLGISSVFLAFYKNKNISKKIKYFISGILIILLTIPAVYNFNKDKRWITLKQTIPIALNTKKYKNWLYPRKLEMPKLSNGQIANGSNYLRFAWWFEGSKIILDHPLGIGFGRNAFGHAIQFKYHLKRRTLGHAHSAIIDLGIQTGIIGIILWFLFGGYLLYLSYKYFFLENNYFAIILFFNVTGFYTRALVDSNMRDHMFLTFMALIGFSLIFMIGGNNKNINLI